MLTYYSVSAFVNCITSALMGILVFVRNRKSPLNITFALFALTMTLWAFFYFLWQIETDYDQTMIWMTALVGVALFIGVTYFHFTLVFLKKARELRWMIIGSYLVMIGFFVVDVFFRPYMITHFEPLSGFRYWPIAGPFFGPWVAFWQVLVIYSSVLLYKKYKDPATDVLYRRQIKLILLGMVITFVGGSTNYFLWWRIPIPPIGNAFATGYVVLSAYAILRYKFLDFRLIIARTISYLLLLVALIFGYIVLISGVSRLLPVTFSQTYVSVGVALVAAFSFNPLRMFLERVTDRVFFQGRYDTEGLLGELTRIMASEIDIKALSEKLLVTLTQQMRVTRGAFVVTDKRKVRQIEAVGFEDKMILDNPRIVDLLGDHTPVYVFEELKDEKHKEVFRRLDIAAVLPLKVKDEEIGLLVLGPKSSGDIYSAQDIRLLEILGPQVGVAIKNAESYEEIQKFAVTLQEEVKKATADLKTANVKLEEMDKQKDEFISVAAHELRAPMTAIKGYLSMIMKGDMGKIPGEAMDSLQDAVEGNDRLIRLVNNMLNVSRIEEGRMVFKMGVVQMTKVVKTVYEEYKVSAAEKKLKFSLEVTGGIKDTVEVDQDRIYEAVSNFVSNAIKYTDKGSVVMRLGQPRPEAVRFEVVDTGAGVSQEEQKKLFGKFVRAESSAGKKLGTGLGLYVVKLLIEKFKGKIGMESEQGKGSTFWFELPVAQANGKMDEEKSKEQ